MSASPGLQAWASAFTCLSRMYFCFSFSFLHSFQSQFSPDEKRSKSDQSFFERFISTESFKLWQNFCCFLSFLLKAFARKKKKKDFIHFILTLLTFCLIESERGTKRLLIDHFFSYPTFKTTFRQLWNILNLGQTVKVKLIVIKRLCKKVTNIASNSWFVNTFITKV